MTDTEIKGALIDLILAIPLNKWRNFKTVVKGVEIYINIHYIGSPTFYIESGGVKIYSSKLAGLYYNIADNENKQNIHREAVKAEELYKTLIK